MGTYKNDRQPEDVYARTTEEKQTGSALPNSMTNKPEGKGARPTVVKSRAEQAAEVDPDAMQPAHRASGQRAEMAHEATHGAGHATREQGPAGRDGVPRAERGAFESIRESVSDVATSTKDKLEEVFDRDLDGDGVIGAAAPK